MQMLNLGCGFDIKPGWVNVDNSLASGVEYWDAIDNVVPEQWVNKFDFILANHLFCAIKPTDMGVVLSKIKMMLNPDGKVQIIDMDVMKVIQSYLDKRFEDIPIETGSPDEKLCYALSGYGTRLSLFTPITMYGWLDMMGFHNIKQLESSEYDMRQKESLIFEATK